MRKTSLFVGGWLVLIVCSGVLPAVAQSPAPGTEALLGNFTYRNLGPVPDGSADADIAVPGHSERGPPLYVLRRRLERGRLENDEQRDDLRAHLRRAEHALAIGDVTLAPSNPEIVWVGTGDAFCSRSSYAGDGVYKSTDGGEDLEEHGPQGFAPHRPDRHSSQESGHRLCRGHGPSVFGQRGAGRLQDAPNGGQTWEKVLYVNEKIGVIDLVMNPRNPDVLYAATYDKQRLPWQYVNGGPGERHLQDARTAARPGRGSADGLPGGRIGRIGIDIYPQESGDRLRRGGKRQSPARRPRRRSNRPGARGAQPREQQIGGELYRTEDGGATWVKMNADRRRRQQQGPLLFQPDPGRSQQRQEHLRHRRVPGELDRRRQDLERHQLAAEEAVRQDLRRRADALDRSSRIPTGSSSGATGGFSSPTTGERRATNTTTSPWDEFYAIGVDMEEPYNIYGGLQDHEHCGRARATAPYGRINRVRLGRRRRRRRHVHPGRSRPTAAGCTRRCSTEDTTGWTRSSGTGRASPPCGRSGKPPYRFIWCTPIHISPHNSQIIYTGGQCPSPVDATAATTGRRSAPT